MAKSRNWTMDDIKKTGLQINHGGGHGTGKNVMAIINQSKNVSHETVLPKSKYGNKKTDGFDSKKEAEIYKYLKLLEKAGDITAIQCQVTFQLSVCKYIADFVYYIKNTGVWEVVDVKGMKTQTYILKKKMMMNELKIQIIEV